MNDIMKNIIYLVFFLLIFSFVCQGNIGDNILLEEKNMSDKYLKKANELAEIHWGKNVNVEVVKSEKSYVKSVRPEDSELITKVLDEYKVFSVEVYNPISQIAGRPYFHYSLVINERDESVYYLENDEDSIKFLSNLSPKITTEEAVKDMLNVFAILRGYKINEQPVEDLRFFRGDKKFTKKDWKLNIKQAGNGWDIFITYLVDPYVHGYARYHIEMTNEGQVIINKIKSASESLYE